VIKAVLLDVGGTLLEVNPSVGEIYARVAVQYGINEDPKVLQKRFRDAWVLQKKKGRHQDKGGWDEIVNEVFAPYPLDNKDELVEKVYDAFRAPDVWHLFPEVIPTIETLKSRGLSLSIASNWDDRLPALLDEMNLTPYFDHQFISFAVGYSKPHPQFFQTALNTLRLSPSEILHVGDDAQDDVVGASALGIHTLLINRKAPSTKPRVISSLAEIPRYL
jgi:putative hydrolase of the HAD superfamily